MTPAGFVARVALTAIVMAAAAPAAAQPNIRNADLQERAAGELARTFQQLAADAGPIWIGYAVAAQTPEWNSCCYNDWSDGRGCCGRCSIEEGRPGEATGRGDGAQQRPIALEGGSEVVVLLRIVGRQVERARSFSQDCEIDAGGRRVYWLTGAQPAASVALLAGVIAAQAETTGKSRIVNGALAAIAAHAAPEATDALIRLAKQDASARTRGEALFWLAQKAGQKAAGTITDAIENDPDTTVKERAVFALSQLPKDDGVPKLIEVARANRNPKVRKQAIFWLGQSKDPRALKFFEEILSKEN
jgi:hypothetical protein